MEGRLRRDAADSLELDERPICLRKADGSVRATAFDY
jgi:hypothetical protein